MYKIVVFIPKDCKEAVKGAMFSAGAGRIGHYDQCSFELEGLGQFRPLEGSNAYIGSVGVVEKVPEYRVEMVCEDAIVVDVVRAMIGAHPYEEPAYDIISVVDPRILLND